MKILLEWVHSMREWHLRVTTLKKKHRVKVKVAITEHNLSSEGVVDPTSPRLQRTPPPQLVLPKKNFKGIASKKI